MPLFSNVHHMIQPFIAALSVTAKKLKTTQKSTNRRMDK